MHYYQSCLEAILQVISDVKIIGRLVCLDFLGPVVCIRVRKFYVSCWFNFKILSKKEHIILYLSVTVQLQFSYSSDSSDRN
jgi:hypothetical protein